MHFGVAVLGLGNMGRHHYDAVLKNPDCKNTYIVDMDLEKFEEENLSGKKTSYFADVLSDCSTDIICIASYDDQHYDQVIKSLNAKKHVFVEKPLCQTKQELLILGKVYREFKRAISSNLVLRTAPLYKYIKNLILEDALGEIYAFDGDYLYGRLHKITDGWRKDINCYSVMDGGGIHMVDLMLWLTDQHPTSVISHCNKIVTKDSLFRYHDFQSSVFKFENGLIGRITANFGCVHNHQHVVRIFGTKGTFIYDDSGARIHWSRDPEKNVEYIKLKPKPDDKAALFHDFVQAISDNNFEHLATREFDLMSVVLAADEALDKIVNIEYIRC